MSRRLASSPSLFASSRLGRLGRRGPPAFASCGTRWADATVRSPAAPWRSAAQRAQRPRSSLLRESLLARASVYSCASPLRPTPPLAAAALCAPRAPRRGRAGGARPVLRASGSASGPFRARGSAWLCAALPLGNNSKWRTRRVEPQGGPLPPSPLSQGQDRQNGGRGHQGAKTYSTMSRDPRLKITKSVCSKSKHCKCIFF